MKTAKDCLIFLICLFVSTSFQTAQKGNSAARLAALASENLPLQFAENSLSYTFPDTIPAIQPGFRNGSDIWLLYAPEFDWLLGNSQTRLMRKYGLLQTMTRGFKEQVNDPARDLVARVQSETSSASFGSNIVIAYNDTSFSDYGSSLSYSNDGGRSWKQTLPPLLPFASGYGDPVVALGPGGVFYYSMLADNSLGLSIVGLTKSTDGGATWSPLANATASVTNGFDFHDKEWMTVDNTTSRFRGNIYVSWTRFAGRQNEQSGIGFVRSQDGGKTWSTFKIIGQPADMSGFVQGSMISVSPAGEVYVVYLDTRLPGVAVVRSTDGGETFGPPVVAFRDPALKISQYLSGGFDNPFLPSIAVDTSNGPARATVYLTFNVRPADSRDQSDVVLIKSTDGGATWSGPVKVHDDQTDTDQFHPSVAVAQDGTVGLMWYDRRNDPTNNVLLDVYMTTSADGGTTFSPNRRVTTANWMLVPTPFTIRAGYHGDYNQMSAGDLGFVVSWADDRSGTDPSIYAAVLSTVEARTQPKDFVLAGKTVSQNVLSGSSASFTIGSRRVGDLSEDIFLEAGPVYPGIKYNFASRSIKAGDEVVLTVETTPETAAGTYALAVAGRTVATVVGRTSPTVPGRTSPVSTGTGVDLARFTVLRLNVSSSSGMRQSPRAISSIRGSVFQPKAVVDGQNNLHVVYGSDPSRLASSFRTLIYARYRAGVQVTSTQVMRLPSASPIPSSLPLTAHNIGIDDAGNITIVWRLFDFDIGVSNIFMSRSTDGGATFSAPKNLTDVTNSRFTVSSPVVAGAASGAINVAYSQFDPARGFTEVVFIRSTDGGATFAEKVNVTNPAGSPPSVSASSPVMAVDRSNTINIAYLRQGDVFFVRSTDGMTFSTAANISRSGDSAFVSSPSIAVDRSGNINVVYIETDFDLNKQDVHLIRSTDGGATFSMSMPVARTLQQQGFRSFVPSVGTDSQGNIGVGWGAFVGGLLFPGGRDVLFAKSGDGGATFSPAVNVANNIGLQVAFPVVISDESGQLGVLWEDETGGNNQIYIVTP